MYFYRVYIRRLLLIFFFFKEDKIRKTGKFVVLVIHGRLKTAFKLYSSLTISTTARGF